MWVNEHIVDVRTDRNLAGPDVVHVTTKLSMSLDDYFIWRRTQEPLGNTFDLPVLPTSKELEHNTFISPAPAKTKKSLTYEQAYNNFVNAPSAYEAIQWKDKMEALVTLHPVEDKKIVKPDSNIPKYTLNDMRASAFVAASIMFIVIVSISHIVWGGL